MAWNWKQVKDIFVKKSLAKAMASLVIGFPGILLIIRQFISFFWRFYPLFYSFLVWF
jgi:hypothetical protein